MANLMNGRRDVPIDSELKILYSVPKPSSSELSVMPSKKEAVAYPPARVRRYRSAISNHGQKKVANQKAKTFAS